jgi:hypothetical protein
MILLNFSHPLTPDQRAAIEQLTGTPLTQELHAPAQFDHQQPYAPQLAALMAQVPLSAAQWQSEPIAVVPPSLNFIAVLLLAELHGRMGYFAPVVRLRPVAGAVPPRFEVAELLNLQALRDAARTRRIE